MTRSGFHPNAIDKNIPPGGNDPSIVPAGCILHIAVSHADSLRPGFTDGRGIESHIYVRQDGRFEQYRSIWFEADAQADGNSFMLDGKLHGFISIETEGDVNEPLTPAQIDTILKFMEWVHSKAPFPRRVAPAWNRKGIGYHRLYSQWNPNNHSCPGDLRISQFNRIILPRFQMETKLRNIAIFRRDVLAACAKALEVVPKSKVLRRRKINQIKKIAESLPKT